MDVQLPICRKHLFFTDTNDIKGLKRTEPWCTAFSQISKKCLEVSTQGFKWPMVKNHLEVNSTWDLVSINSNSRFESPWKAHPKKSPGKDYPFFPITITLKLTPYKKIMTTHYITNPTNKLPQKPLKEVGCFKKNDVQGLTMGSLGFSSRMLVQKLRSLAFEKKEHHHPGASQVALQSWKLWEIGVARKPRHTVAKA